MRGEPITNRYDFVLYYDVENGNPNGDPDADNMPRVDVNSGHGLVTDVCLKRKIRNYVEAVQDSMTGYDLYVKSGSLLNTNDERALDSLGLVKGQLKQLKKKDPTVDARIRDFMCETFFDIRTFGAVMTTFVSSGLNCGQIRGPVQLTFSKSVDPIQSQCIGITRVNFTTQGEADKKNGNTEMGRKYIVPYGLYRCEGFVSANLARKVTGFSEDDLDLLWEALINMFELDHSAARGKMAVRALIVFKHDSEFGNAPSHQLFEAVSVQKNPDVEYPRSFADYGEITVDEACIPAGVHVIRKV